MEKIKEFFHQDWTLTEKILLTADVLLAGVLIGWLTSPLKDLKFFSNNTINSDNCDCFGNIEEEEE